MNALPSSLLLVSVLLSPFALTASDLPPGYPDRSAELDALPGFQNPPAGYGEVPFWWWTGDDLDEERLLWQVREIHKKGISGVQVNYSHTDSPGWPSDAQSPAIFTDDWWKIYSRISEECAKLDMGISMSTYTLDWDNGGDNLFKKLFYDKPELNAIELKGAHHPVKAGETKNVPAPANTITAWAYPLIDQKPSPQGAIELPIKDASVNWTAPKDKDYQIWIYTTKKHPGTLNPLLKKSGQTVVEGYYQEFENQNVSGRGHAGQGNASKGLNYFFNDELEIGLKKHAWNPDFPAEFKKQHGYDLFPHLPAMWTDMGDSSTKTLIDYADTRMALMEERYFKPIYDWHTSRGIIFGCDNHGRGLQPDAYGDYVRATRWYSAPGHDTPMGHADLIKGKVSSSIAHLYQRPRVWLEGYHSIGWGATPENLMFATNENYLYGCTLLNLHGLYYSTHGSHWEWAPPCHHFRMPYWDHMGKFLKYFERLSYLMSQGQHVADIAIIYPVTPYEAELNGKEATATSFHIANKLMAAGINFDFIDHQSIDQAKVVSGRGHAGQGSGGKLVLEREGKTIANYTTLIFPNMQAVRYSNLEKAASFTKAGGQVLNIGDLPTTTNKSGTNAPELTTLLEKSIPTQNRFANSAEALERIHDTITYDVKGASRTVRYQHRKIGQRDLYMVMDAQPGDHVQFRALGQPELWDPWTGTTSPLPLIATTDIHSTIELPLEKHEAQVVVFTPGTTTQNSPVKIHQSQVEKPLPTDNWQVEFLPNVNNQWGDFRLPVTEHNKIIGLEAREFQWTRGNETRTQLHGHGTQFLLNGDTPYEFSWRMGHKNDAGHQGFHGSKGKVSDNFIRLGNYKYTGNGGYILDRENPAKGPFILTTNAIAERDGIQASIHVSTPAESNAGYRAPNTIPVTTPDEIYLNGNRVTDLTKPVLLKKGANPLKLIYHKAGESHFVLRDTAVRAKRGKPLPLSMSWHQDPAVIHFAPYAHQSEPSLETFAFTSAPGTTSITIPAHLSSTPILAFHNGAPMKDLGNGTFSITQPTPEASQITLQLTAQPGVHGGALLPEPITIQTDSSKCHGLTSLGDWSTQGVLRHYSGGARFTKTFTLTEEEVAEINTLDLEKVVATAEVTLNGQDLGVRVAPPWKFDLKDALKAGENTLSITVFNTLSNHYQTIPTHYKGTPTSGILGTPTLLKATK